MKSVICKEIKQCQINEMLKEEIFCESLREEKIYTERVEI